MPPPWLFWAACAVCVPLALIRAWYIQFLAREAAEERAEGDFLSPEQRAKIGKLIHDGQMLRATMPTMPGLWNANVNAWQLEAAGFLESAGQTLALHDFRTLIGVVSKDEIVVNRYWLGHCLDVLMRL